MTTAYKNLKEKIIGTAIGVVVIFGLPMYGVINLAHSKLKNFQSTNSPSTVAENNYSNTVFYGIRPVNIDNVREDLERKLEEKQ